MTDTIFALSSGAPPAGIAIIRISGPQAGTALAALAGSLPAPRRASHRTFRDGDGEVLDDGLALWFPGPSTATGEDLAELHIHGGRAVVAAVLSALGCQSGLRPALAGEFTRRAFENGRIDLTEAEGLADLLAAETETQRQSALALAEGGLGRLVAVWQGTVLHAAAMIEAELDFSDESDVEDRNGVPLAGLKAVADEMAMMLAAPPAERLKDGVRLVLAGPPNSGKSSLFNMLTGRDAAIVSPVAGTTRDRIEAPVVLDGLPLLLIDTAGLRRETHDEIEAIGIARATEALAAADLVLWLGPDDGAPPDALRIAPKSDLGPSGQGLPVSVVTGAGLPELRKALVDRVRALLPRPGSLVLNARHRHLIGAAHAEIAAAVGDQDALIAAERLRVARGHLDTLTGKAGVEDMLDALFGALCIGK